MLWSGKMLRQNCSCQNKQSEWYNDTSAAYPDPPPPKFYQLGWSSVDSLNLYKERIIKSFTNTWSHSGEILQVADRCKQLIYMSKQLLTQSVLIMLTCRIAWGSCLIWHITQWSSTPCKGSRVSFFTPHHLYNGSTMHPTMPITEYWYICSVTPCT